MKINQIVRQMQPPRYTRAEVAQMLGKSLDTVKRWDREGIYRPSDSCTFGKLTVSLYTDEDLANMRQIAKTLKAGRRRRPYTPRS